MRIPAILLALAAILGHWSSTPKAPAAQDVVPSGTDEKGSYFWMGATKIYLGGFEPAPTCCGGAAGIPLDGFEPYPPDAAGPLSGVFDPVAAKPAGD